VKSPFLPSTHDFEELDGVHELSELRELAVANLPDVRDREV
jgi:hypothetical protein